MRHLPLVLLLHTASTGHHHDLLVLDPTVSADAEHRLWAARVTLPTAHWAAATRLVLRPLPHHRTRYLEYAGPLSGGRGRVRRVDWGLAVERIWTPRRLVLDLRTRQFHGRLTLTRRSCRHWDAVADAGLVGGAMMR